MGCKDGLRAEEEALSHLCCSVTVEGHLLTTGHLSSRHPVVVGGVRDVGRHVFVGVSGGQGPAEMPGAG
jgi:hypothetical protein